MNNFDKILEKIEHQQIEPTPKWYFQFKNWGFWCLFVISILIGSMAFSIILYSIQQTDFVLISHFSHSSWENILVLLPYFWLILLLVFSILAFFSFKNFKKAYKYSLVSILALSVFLSILLGTLSFISGIASFLENKFAYQVEIYNSIEEKKLQHWMQPKAGFLAGEIIDSKIDTLLIKDFSGKEWQIIYHEIFIPPILELENGISIKVMGKIQSDNIFIAEQIRPWKAFGGQDRSKNKKKKK